MSPKVDQIYSHHIQPLAREERLELLALMARELTPDPNGTGPVTKYSILELEGLGSEIWGGIDAQDYVDRLRAEWEGPSG